jgi:FAD:protein FMN transferase
MRIALLSAVLLLASAACALSAEPATFTGSTMGTSYTVRVAGLPSGINPQELHEEIDRRLERVNDQMSTWRPDSELSRFNRYRATDWFAVSSDTARVIDAAIRIGRESKGAFEVTIGPLVNLWQFGAEQRAAPPSEAEIAAALATVGYEQLEVRSDPPAVRKSRPEVYVDLSGIAKGYGVDVIAELLRERGVAGYMVEIGGEVRTLGTKDNGSPWRIGIEAPTDDRRSLQRVVILEGKSLATSGDYRNFREHEARRVSHTIDPRTGRPIEHALASVSVVADNCMEADALATALMVLGPDDAYNFAAERELPALLIVREGNRFVERATPQFAQLLATQPQKKWGGAMEIFVIAFLVFALAIAAMAVGLMGKRRIRGSCGGLANLRDATGRSMCDACTDPLPECGGLDDGRRRSAHGSAHQRPQPAPPVESPIANPSDIPSSRR